MQWSWLLVMSHNFDMRVKKGTIIDETPNIREFGSSRTVQSKRNLPDQIVDLFLALVFTEKLVAGDRLPPELKLTEILKVNRSSLRMAMRVLARMNVVKSTRGSGLVVLDYKKNTGLDFIGELVRIPELDLGSKFLIQVLEGTRPIFKLLANSFVEKDSIERCIHYLNVLDLQIRYLTRDKNLQALVRLDISLQNEASIAFGNPLLRASFNSFLPIRQYLMEIYYSMDGNGLTYIQTQKNILLAYIRKDISGEQFVSDYLDLIYSETGKLQTHLKTLSQDPVLKTSPLQHYPTMTCLNAG